MAEKKHWHGLKTIGKIVTTIEKNEKKTKETRYCISSCKINIKQFQQTVREHWEIESMHWHLDVTFNEDRNYTLDKNAAQNLNLVRKMTLPLLKNIPFEPEFQDANMKLRRLIISWDFPFYLGMIYEMFFVH